MRRLESPHLQRLCTEADNQHLTRAVILAAEARLRRCPFPALRLVFCTFHDGILTLAGQVPSPFLRQLAPLFVQGLRGVDTVANELVIVPVSRTAAEPAFRVLHDSDSAFFSRN
jgi:hypothetical protein